jgi:Spy/CpxP family protein refolding chaperone
MNDWTKPDPAPRRGWRRRSIVSLVAGLAAGLGASLGASLAHAHGPGGWGGWHRSFDESDPQAMQRRAEARVKWMLADIDATDAQHQRIADITVTLMRELRPLRDQAREARRQVMDILSKPQIDRGALEALRAKQAQTMDQISRRISQSLADAAEVLTPDQRAKLAERMGERRHRHGRR